MAQAGYTPISLFYSTTASAAPTAGSLVNGELAINITDGKLYYKDNAGVVQLLVSKGATGPGGSNTQVQYNNAGAFAGSANMTFNGTTLTLTNDASINGLTVGKGGGNNFNNTIVGSAAFASGAAGGNYNSAFGYAALNATTTGTNNTAIGAQSLAFNTASNNIAVGYQAGYSNTTGSPNTFLGYQAGYTGNGAVNTLLGVQAGYAATGSIITAVGHQAGYNTTDGSGNDFFGYKSGYANTSGTANAAFGTLSLNTNTTGSQNTSVGVQSLNANTTGANNTALGYTALYSNTTASNNTAVGYQASYTNSTGVNNTSIGFQASYLNTTGGYSVSVGESALYSNTTGNYNVAIGRQSLGNNTTASNNTAVGYQAGYTNTTGAYNVFLGYQAGYTSNYNGNSAHTCVGQSSGYSLTTGLQNTCIGSSSGYYLTTGSYNTILGSFTGNQGGLDIRTASNYIVLSDGSGNPQLISNISSNTTSLNINSNSGGNYSILNYTFNNVTSAQAYYYAPLSTYNIVNGGSGGVYLASGGVAWLALSDARFKENLVPITDALTKVNSLSAVTGNLIDDKTKKSRAFLIAQEVQEVLPEAVDATDPDKLGLAYTDTIPLLVAAIKELKAEFDAYKATHP